MLDQCWQYASESVRMSLCSLWSVHQVEGVINLVEVQHAVWIWCRYASEVTKMILLSSHRHVQIFCRVAVTHLESLAELFSMVCKWVNQGQIDIQYLTCASCYSPEQRFKRKRNFGWNSYHWYNRKEKLLQVI